MAEIEEPEPTPMTLEDILIDSLTNDAEAWFLHEDDYSRLEHHNGTVLHYYSDYVTVESEDAYIHLDYPKQKIINKLCVKIYDEDRKRLASEAMQKALARFGH